MANNTTFATPTFATAKILGTNCIFMDKNDNIVFSIKVGDSIECGDKIWIVSAVPDKKNPKSYVFKLVCDEAYCFIGNNKFGYLDLDSDIPFRTPKNALEAFLMNKGIFKHINYLRYDDLSSFVTVGGSVKVGRKTHEMLSVITDGTVAEHNHEIPFKSMKVDGATYIVETATDSDGIVWPTKLTVKYSEEYSAMIEALRVLGPQE